MIEGAFRAILWRTRTPAVLFSCNGPTALFSFPHWKDTLIDFLKTSKPNTLILLHYNYSVFYIRFSIMILSNKEDNVFSLNEHLEGV